jgi:hypothetical protein
MNLVMFAVNHFCLMIDILFNIKKIFKFKTSLQNQGTDFAYLHADFEAYKCNTLENKNVYYDIFFNRNKKICPYPLAVKESKKDR